MRPVDIASWEVSVTREAGGVMRVRPTAELGPYPVTLTERLDHWAQVAPERLFLAKREPKSGVWRELTYREFRRLARHVAQALLKLGLPPQRPIVILSSNDLEHAILGVAAMYAGLPYAPVSPAYSLVSKDFGKLRHIFGLLNPSFVFAADGHAFGRAIEAVVPVETPVAVTIHPPPGREPLLFETLCRKPAAERPLPDAGADDVAKILFTSGSTGVPKGVINTHRMLCSNQEMLATVFQCFRHTPPVICDWLPWNHTFGGNHNFGLVLYNGGSLYIDDGKPLGTAFEETVRNLREIATTVYFNVPKGYEALVARMSQDEQLRRVFFSRLSMTFYAAASLAQHVWDALDALAVATCGQRVAMLTGLGATETAPFAICVNKESARAGVVGLPVPGMELKLVPAGPKWEARLQGPNVTPGYWGQPEISRAAFDEEGFYRMGDALRCLDDAAPAKGFVFDGRLTEDFKLSTGTWVSVGPLRAKFIQHFAPFVRDVVISGHDRDEVTALIFPDVDEYERLKKTGQIRETFLLLLRGFAAGSTGSSTRIERAIVLEEPPSLDGGEVTDKGSINQLAVLERRRALVEALYQPSPAEFVLTM